MSLMPIIHQYLTLPKTILRPPGFGDFLRGTIALYQYSYVKQIPLYVTFDGHPIGEYLVKIPHPPLTTPVIELINCDPKKNPLSPQQLASALDKYDLLSQTITVCTNAFFRWGDQFPLYPLPSPTSTDYLPMDCIQFMQSLLTPTPSFQSKIDEVMNQVGIVKGGYDVIHLRSGDPSFMTQNLKSHHYNSLILSKIKPEIDTMTPHESCVMIADNLWIKNQIITDYSWITSLETEPTHLGSVVRSNQSLSRVEDTLIDFFVISMSRSISQFSVYNWGSGFSDISHHIFGQPISHTYLKL